MRNNLQTAVNFFSFSPLKLKTIELKTFDFRPLNFMMVGETLGPMQRGLNRWSNNSEQKIGFLSKVKILKNAFNKK